MPRTPVPKTRNNATQTEAAYWGSMRSALRRTYRWWKPLRQALFNARVEYHGENKRQKWVYQCAGCQGFFKGTEVQVDHIVPVGELTCLDHLPGFVERLTSEDLENYQVLCKPCHQIKSNHERENANKSKSANSDVLPNNVGGVAMGAPYID